MIQEQYSFNKEKEMRKLENERQRKTRRSGRNKQAKKG